MNLAIIGIGLIGKRHAQAIWNSGRANLIAIVDPTSEGEAFATKHNVPWFANLDDLLTKVKPDGIILATPNSLHLEQGLKCITYRIPVLIEKPITISVVEGQILVEAVKKSGVAVLVGHHRRHNSLIQKAKEIILLGKIGEIRAVHAQTWFYKPDSYFDKVAWRKQEGAGPISVNLVHDIDCLRYLCGEIIEVQSQIRKSLRGYENEDTGAALLSFANGAIGTITGSDSIVSPWSWEMSSQEYPIYPPASKSCYYIGGSRGSLSVPDLTLWSYQEERDWWKPIKSEHIPRDNCDPLINQIIHFCNVINGEDPLVSAEEAVKTLKVIEAIKNSG